MQSFHPCISSAPIHVLPTDCPQHSHIPPLSRKYPWQSKEAALKHKELDWSRCSSPSSEFQKIQQWLRRELLRWLKFNCFQRTFVSLERTRIEDLVRKGSKSDSPLLLKQWHNPEVLLYWRKLRYIWKYKHKKWEGR